jgi:hypothetical protein
MKHSRAELRQFVRDYLADKSCSKCPENHIACLDFHHRDPSEKNFKINEAYERRYSKSKIMNEIQKCDILCSNCHRKEHFNIGH